jgi:hypothetical protein
MTYKHERNLGSGNAVRHIRDGVSFERLLSCADLAANKAAARLAMLRWALFQFLIGNSDAHGKNFSFFGRPGGLLEPLPLVRLGQCVAVRRFRYRTGHGLRRRVRTRKGIGIRLG